MKKFIAVVLALVLCMSLCAFASADTTEARSGNITVSVKQYEIKAGNNGGSADKNTDPSTVMTEIKLNRENWNQAQFIFTGAVNKTIEGTDRASILASELLEGVESSCTKTVYVESGVFDAKETWHPFEKITLTYYIVWAGEEVNDEDSTGDATTGDFTVSLGSSYTAWEGDLIKFDSIGYVVSNDLKSVIESNYTVTYKVYLYADNKIVGTIDNASADNNVFEVYAAYGTNYIAWAVGTLTYTAKAPASK